MKVVTLEEEHPNCTRLMDRGDEWDIIAMFHEWLKEKGIWLAHTITKQEFYGEDYEDEPMDTMVPIPQTLRDLFYEYGGVDPVELERERRRLLEKLRGGK